jgi:glycosyltransferase involved in cell wall biosynthesis
MFDIIMPSVGRISIFNAIQSVLDQDNKDWELWIMCDGLRGLDHAVGHPQVHVLGSSSPVHHDYGAWARNEAIKLGWRPWIAYIDDDDTWLPHHLSVISSMHESLPHATLIRTAGQSFKLGHKSPRSSELVRKLGPVNSTDVLTVGMVHTRVLFQKTSGWQPCDNHDKLLREEMIRAGGSEVVSPEVTFQFER